MKSAKRLERNRNKKSCSYVGLVKEDLWTEIAFVCLFVRFVCVELRSAAGKGSNKGPDSACGTSGVEWREQRWRTGSRDGRSGRMCGREESRRGENGCKRKNLRRVESAGGRGRESSIGGTGESGEWKQRSRGVAGAESAGRGEKGAT